MRRFLRKCCLRKIGCTVVLLAIAWCCQSTGALAQSDAVNRGRDLFERIWSPLAVSAAGQDGLGPLFNERSCVGCHKLGGHGGAGPIANNVDLLTRPRLATSRVSLDEIHPAFATASTIVVHKFSVNAQPYDDFRTRLLGVRSSLKQPADQPYSRYPVKFIRKPGVKLALSQRNTTPLFGIGMIAGIPRAEIAQVVEAQPAEDPNVSGRFVGRFGWRGQLDDLTRFVRSACAVELGLKVKSFDQALDPLKQVTAESEPDLSDKECQQLTAFVASLPRPRQVNPDQPQDLVRVEHGEQLFASVGCAVCHRPQLGQVAGLYSDLLLHDMGEGLIDPAPAPVVLQASAGGYYQGDETARVLLTSLREWKTPPLWGLRDSGPYLHDGRAATIAEAIEAHGGEALGSLQRYRRLPGQQRWQILAFLETLAAPSQETLAAQYHRLPTVAQLD